METMENKKFDKETLERLQAEAAEPTVALNPLTGFHLDDLVEMAQKTTYQGLLQPAVLTKHVATHGRKLLEIISGDAEYEPDKGDRRFKSNAWSENKFYRGLMQSYLALNETLEEWVTDLNLDEVEGQRATFLARVVCDSIAPTNNLFSNPDALRLARESGGQSLLKGLENFISDIRHNHGLPSQVDKSGFKVGENLAISSGSVVFKNEIIELIQYTPVTKKVYKRPLMLVPAKINKFYALDLRPNRSFIEFCVANGIQLYCVSFRNPGLEHAHWGVDEYVAAMIEGVGAVKSISRCKDVNLFALCSGGMSASAMAGHLHAKGKKYIHSMSLGVCMLNMAPGDMEIGAFANETVMEAAKSRSKKAGLLRGHELASSMMWLRPGELIWGNVVNNYLLGKKPPEFDLMFWNNDWTNLTGKLHGDIIDMFWTGCLSIPNEMNVCGTPVDLQSFDCDKFFVGALTDHITPWKACYRSAHAHGGNKTFLLSNSGHMQTFLNSPARPKSSYFLNEELPDSSDDWLEGADLHKGSWWTYWLEWIQQRSGEMRNAPQKLGNAKFKATVDAPGEYVHDTGE